MAHRFEDGTRRSAYGLTLRSEDPDEIWSDDIEAERLLGDVHRSHRSVQMDYDTKRSN